MRVQITLAIIGSLWVSPVMADDSIPNPKVLSREIEGVIDRYYNSSENYYTGIAIRLVECAYIYKNIDTPNTPHKVKRNREGYSQTLTIASKELLGNQWDATIQTATAEKIKKLQRTPRAISQIVFSCNMYLDEDRVKDAIYATANPSPYFDIE